MSLLIDHFYKFGDFTLDGDQRILLRKGRPQQLAPKVFDTLLVLVEQNGRIVSKDELMSRLWPDTFVEEANLTFNIQQLRKALGDKARKPRYIETVTRRGYRFIADVEEVLSEGGGHRIKGAFENPDIQATTSSGKPEGTTQDVDVRFELPSGLAQPERTEKHSDLASMSSRRRRFLLVAGVLAVLAGVGLLTREFLKTDGTDSKRVAIEAATSFPPRIEKLTETGQSRLVAISPDGKYVAYTRNFESKSSLWLRQLATNNNIEIVPAGGAIYGLAIANGGEYLYFARRGEPIAEPAVYRTALYRVSLVGGVPTKVIDTLEGNFSISPDDKQIALIRQTINPDGERQFALMVVDADGTGQRTVLVGTHPENLDHPVWSPSGQSIIFTSGDSDGGGQKVHLIQVKLADGTKTELSPEKFYHISRIAWLPGKSAFIMTARKSLGCNNQLWRVTYPGAEINQISDDLSNYLDLSIASSTDSAVATQATRVSDIWMAPTSEPQKLKKITQGIEDFCWTPKGRVIYSSTATGNIDLWIMQSDGSEQRQLTVKSGVNLRPAVAPDSEHIVFMSNRTGSFQAWRMNLDGGNQMQLTDGAPKDYPAVSPDGKWVFYNTTDDWHLWRVSIDGGEPSEIARYVASHPSVSPDGKMIACIGRNELARKILVLSFESGEVLKEFSFVGWSSRIRWAADGKALTYCSVHDGTGNILEQSLDGGPPKQVLDLGEDELFDFGYSFDGQLLAITRGGWKHDAVLISDFNRSWDAGNSGRVSPMARR